MKKNIKFSDFFELGREQIDLDFVNIYLQRDTHLFLDPWAIKISENNSDLYAEMYSLISSYFQTLLQSISSGKTEEALDLLDFLHEGRGAISGCVHLGYSNGAYGGSAFGQGKSESVFDALSKSNAVTTRLLKDLEDTALMIDNISSDNISDLIANVIAEPLIRYTEEQCQLYGIETKVFHGINFWDEHQKQWTENNNVRLPFVPGVGKIVLVPKSIVRRGLIVNSDDFYNKEILEFEQARHLDARSSLCRILKNKTYKKPAKKDLKEIVKHSKADNIKYIKKNPELLIDFKNTKIGKKQLKDNDIYLAQENPKRDIRKELDKKTEKFKSILPGKKHAYLFHNHILDSLNAIFYPDLQNPRKEDPILSGDKKIDITYVNNSQKGFFNNLSRHDITCAKIFFECKNYVNDIENPEFDQMLGRFNTRTSTIGFIVCRKIMDKKKILQKCRNYAQTQQKFIIVLDDVDIINLLSIKNDKDDNDKVNIYLQSKLDEIITA